MLRGEDDIWTPLTLLVTFSGFSFVSGGITAGREGLIWWKYRHQSPITHQRSALSTWFGINQELRDMMLKMHALVLHMHGKPVHDLCSRFIKHVTISPGLFLRSRSSPASGCLYSGYQSSLFIINVLTARKIYFLQLNALIKLSLSIFLSISLLSEWILTEQVATVLNT